MSLSNGVLYAMPPPDGYIPDFTRPYHATGLIVCIGIFLPLAVLSTSVRMYTRFMIVCSVALDDYFMVAALACSVVLTGLILNLLNYGLGMHLWDVPLDWLYPKFLFSNLLAAIFFCAATGFAKTSILLFYIRIFPSYRFQIVIYIMVAFTTAYSAASVFVNIVSCNPVAKSWELKYANTGSCIHRPVFYFAQAGLGIFTDFAILIAPMPSIWKLRLPLKQKIGIAAVLTTGGFVCIVSIIRLQSLYVLLKAVDLTGATGPALMWCVVELNVSILGGCVPTFKPFLRQHFPGPLGAFNEHEDTSSEQDTGIRRNMNMSISGSHQLRSLDLTGNKTYPGVHVSGVEPVGTMDF